MVARPQNNRVRNLISLAATGTDTSPSTEQKASGNYRKGRFSMRGMQFVIENPKGTVRSGNGWQVVMPAHYGYILKTKSDADGDHLDVFIGPDPESDTVFAIDQSDIRNPDKFDEHKFMIGFLTRDAAVQAYNDAFNGSSPISAVVDMSWEDFKTWIEFGDSSTPIVDQMLRSFNSRVELMKSHEDTEGNVYVYGACMVPNLVDRSPFRDYYTEDDVRSAARGYMMKSQKAGYRHKAIFLNEDVQLTQSFITPVPIKIGEKDIPKGSWVVEFKLNHPEAIRMAKAGEFAAFSIGGPSRKWRLEKRDGSCSPWYGPGRGDN